MPANNSLAKRAVSETTSLLYWSMLAAGTIGPGSVITCSRAGAEEGLKLVWTLVFATLMTFTLQEGAARLAINSGKSLGQCLRIKYGEHAKIYDTALVCWATAICIYAGNTMYEVNCFAGGISAIDIMPGVDDTVGMRVGSCIGYAILVYALLFWDKTRLLSIGLGFVLVGMAVLFLVVVIELGLDWERFAEGLIPTIPKGSVNTVLGLVGTTTLGFNLFLGSTMAEKDHHLTDDGERLASAQRGVAFSAGTAAVISLLIMIVGDGVTTPDSGEYEIVYLGDLIEDTLGTAGLWVFAIGFVAAAFSSMLAVPLGAAVATDSMFTAEEEEVSKKGEVIQPKLPNIVYQGIMLSMIIISAVIISFDVNTEKVVQSAQVFNGCLLPFFATCLLLCLNDSSFMGKKPQSWWANLFLILAVTATLFLAVDVFLTNVIPDMDETTAMIVSGAVAPALMIVLLLATSLGRGVKSSFFGSKNEEDLVLEDDSKIEKH